MSHQDDVFFRTFILVLAGLGGLAAVFFIIAQMFSGEPDDNGQAKDVRVQNAIEERIEPVGRVTIGEAGAEASPAETPIVVRSGKEIVTASCASCHATGVIGAPKIGDPAAWEARLANGLDSLLHNALNGLNAMPARGGNAALSDGEVKSAVVSMLEDSGLDATASTSASTASVTTSTGEAAEPPQEVADDSAEQRDLEHGKSIYSRACFACHGTGAAGAPKLGDQASWSERIAKGLDSLVQRAVSGFQGRRGYMPPKGGHPYLSDSDIRDSVAYMVSESQ